MGVTDDTLTDRGGMALFVKYLSSVEIYPTYLIGLPGCRVLLAVFWCLVRRNWASGSFHVQDLKQAKVDRNNFNKDAVLI